MEKGVDLFHLKPYGLPERADLHLLGACGGGSQARRGTPCADRLFGDDLSASTGFRSGKEKAPRLFRVSGLRVWWWDTHPPPRVA